MYEMKGALSGHSPGSASFPASRLRVSQSPGLTVPDRLISQPHRPRSTGRPTSLFRFVRSPGLPGATRRPPVPDTRCKFRFPCLCIAPGEPPGWCPFPAVRTFLRPQPVSRKSRRNSFYVFFLSTSCPQNFASYPHVASGYPPPYAQLLHRSPDVTQGIPTMTAHHNHSVFSRRPSVNPEFRPPLPSAPLPVRASAPEKSAPRLSAARPADWSPGKRDQALARSRPGEASPGRFSFIPAELTVPESLSYRLDN